MLTLVETAESITGMGNAKMRISKVKQLAKAYISKTLAVKEIGLLFNGYSVEGFLGFLDELPSNTYREREKELLSLRPLFFGEYTHLEVKAYMDKSCPHWSEKCTKKVKKENDYFFPNR